MSDSELVAVFSALGHEIRFSVWRLLLPHGTDGLPAGTIAVQMSIPPSSLSFHLRQMTHAGVLVQRRYRRNVIYAVNLDVLDQLAALQVISFGPTRKSSHEVCHIIGD